MRVAILAASLVALMPGGADASAGQVVDRVLAVVAGRAITLSDTRATIELGFVQPRPGVDPTSDALAYLVNRQLMLAEVDRYSAPAPDARVLDKRLAAIRAHFPSAAVFQQALARTALTDTRLRDIVGDSVRIENYLDQRFGAAAQPTSEEVERYYLDHRAEFAKGGQPVPFESVQAQVLERVTAERRNSLIAEWLDRLRRQFTVTMFYSPGS